MGILKIDHLIAGLFLRTVVNGLVEHVAVVWWLRGLQLGIFVFVEIVIGFLARFQVDNLRVLGVGVGVALFLRVVGYV